MKIVVFGANGATGRLLVGRAAAAGHAVVAVTRRPDAFPVRHPRIEVVEADAHDPVAVKRALQGGDAVLSVLGLPFTRRPVLTYSEGTAAIAAGMADHGIDRLAVVSSSATEPHHHAEGGFVLNRVVQPLLTATIGRTTYADMRRMEELVVSSDLAWTIVRPSGLFDADRVSGYDVREDRSDGVFTSRIDLADCLLAQATSTEWVRRRVAVTTREGAPTLWQLVRREAFGGQ